MKQVEKKIQTSQWVYEAFDGQQFSSEVACKQYEDSGRCALASYLKDKTLKRGLAGELMSFGCYEDDLMVIVPKTSDDIVKIKQLVASAGSPENVDSVTEEHIGKVVMVDLSYDMEGAFAYTLDGLVRSLTNGAFKVVPADEK